MRIFIKRFEQQKNDYIFEISVEYGVDSCVYFVDLKNVSQRYFFDFYKKNMHAIFKPVY
jgi:hypothetical protein